MWTNLSTLAKKGMDIASDVSNTIAPLLAEENPWNEDEGNSGFGSGNEEDYGRGGGKGGGGGGGKNTEQEEDYSSKISYDRENDLVTGSADVSIEPSLQLEGKNRMLRDELEEMEKMFHASTHELQRLLNEREMEVSELKSALQLSAASISDRQLSSQHSTAYDELLVEVEMLRRKVRDRNMRDEKEVAPAVATSVDRPPRADTEETAIEEQPQGEQLASKQSATNKGHLQSELEHQAEDFHAQFESMQNEIAMHEQQNVNLMGELASLKNELQVHDRNLLQARKQAEISESEISSLNALLDGKSCELTVKEDTILSQEFQLLEMRTKYAKEPLLLKEEKERNSMSSELQQQLLASAQEEIQKLRASLSSSTEHDKSSSLRTEPTTERDSAGDVNCLETTAMVADLSLKSSVEAKLEEMKFKFDSQTSEMDHLRAQIRQYEREVTEGKQERIALTNDMEQLQTSNAEDHEELKGKSHELDVLKEEMRRMHETGVETQTILEGKFSAMEDQSAELMRIQHSIEQLQEELGEKSSTILTLTSELELLRQKAKEGLDDDHHQSATLVEEEDLKGSSTERISADNRIHDNLAQQNERERSMKLEAELKEVLQKLELNEGIEKRLQGSEELAIQAREALVETQSKLEMTERELAQLKRDYLEAKSSAQQLLQSIERVIPTAAAVSEGEEQQLSIPVVHHIASEAMQILWDVSDSAARRLADVLSSAGIKCKLVQLEDVINALEEAAAAGSFSSSRAETEEDNNSEQQQQLRGRISMLEKEIFSLSNEVSVKDKTCSQLKVIIDQLRSAHRSGAEASSVLSAERDQLATTVKQAHEELEYQQGRIKDLESRLSDASSKEESIRELQNKVTVLQKEEMEARVALAAEEAAVVEDLEKERVGRQEALREAQESVKIAVEAQADLAMARADAERAQEAVTNMQRAFELFHEERAAELNTLKQQFKKQENESTLALNECKKAFNEARESEKAAMDALNVVTERERVVGIELKPVQEEAESKSSALSNARYPSPLSFHLEEQFMDKQLATNLVVKYISTHHDKRVLELMARVFNFTHNDLEAVGLERKGPGLMSEIINNMVGRGENEEEEIGLADLISKGATLGDAWVNFLLSGQQLNGAEQLTETEKEAAVAAATTTATATAAEPLKESLQPTEEQERMTDSGAQQPSGTTTIHAQQRMQE